MKIIRRNNNDVGRRAGDTVWSRPTPPEYKTNKQENNHKYRDSPQVVMGLSPTLGSTVWKSCTLKFFLNNY